MKKENKTYIIISKQWFSLWKLKGHLSQVLETESIEVELGKRRTDGHQKLSGLDVQTLSEVEMELFGKAGLEPPGAIGGPETEYTFLFFN